MRSDIMLRCTDLVKLIDGAHHQLLTLQQMTEVINTRQLEGVFKNVETNTKFLVDASAASERASASLEVMQIILAGSFAFDIIDRSTGGTLNIVVPNWVDEYFVAPIISIPFLFWFLNMCWLGFVCFFLMKFMRYLAAQVSPFPLPPALSATSFPAPCSHLCIHAPRRFSWCDRVWGSCRCG